MQPPLPPRPPKFPPDPPKLPPLPIGLDEPLPFGEDIAIRLLSLDGGGIYGYTTACMLRELCETNDSFLLPWRSTAQSEESADPQGEAEEARGAKDAGSLPQPQDQPGAPWAYAGTSAGALNALLMAKESNPREYVLAGELQRFWQDRGTFAGPDNPLDWMLSWSGMTAWFGSKRYTEMLQAHFGNRRLGDLPNRVIIMSFNWAGRDGGMSSGWRPKVFTNYPADNPDRDIEVYKVAYAAAAPTGLRPIRWGLGDGGTSDPDPARAALMEVIKKLRRDDSPVPSFGAMARAEGVPHLAEKIGEAVHEAVASLSRLPDLGVLQFIRVLSLGVAAKVPSYWQNHFNLGSMLFNSLPTNPPRGQMWPPFWDIAIDAPTETSVHACEVLLQDRYCRLDPPLLGPPQQPPTLAATMLARFPQWQEYLIQQQRAELQSETALRALGEARAFIDNGWKRPEP
ncbi:MAG: patatin-like phospholipase family protein [Acidobacteriota bacterium]